MKKMLMVMAVAAALLVPGKISANSIIPHLVSVGPGGGGTFLWTWSLELNPSSEAWSATDICAGNAGIFASYTNPIVSGFGSCPGPPVAGSAMFNFSDFTGAVDYFGGPLGDGSDVLWTPSVAAAPGDWFSLIYPVGDNIVGPILPTGANTCGAGPGCPSDSAAVPNVLLAWASSLPDAGYLGATLPFGVNGPWFELGVLVIRSLSGTQSTNEEGYLGTDLCTFGCVPPQQTNLGLYLPPANPVPEPATLLLLGTGLLGLGSRLRKKIKKDTPTV